MREVVVLSGKGGTGKTSIVGSFAAIAENKVMADCDVDAADLHLLLHPSVVEEHEFRSGQVAVIDEAKCIQCGFCETVCRFDAIHDYTVDPVSCEGCGFCSLGCRAEAITMRECMAGKWFISQTVHGPLVHARLGIAQENSGKLVTLVKQQAKTLAEKEKLDYVICDGPPGIGCPVISSLSGADLAVIVTEPTLSGIHDMERVTEVCQHFGVPVMVCINKYDLNDTNTVAICDYCRENDIEIPAMIPFDKSIIEAMVKGKAIIECSDSRAAREIRSLWKSIEKKLRENNAHIRV